MNDKRGFSVLEILIIIVIAGIALICGLVIAFSAKKNGEMKTFQDRAVEIIGVSKQVFNDFERDNKTDYIGSINNSKGMCITLNGLYKNDYYTKELKDYEGYVVIEKVNDDITYTLWLTNKKFVIKGIDSEKIETEKAKKIISDIGKEKFSMDIKTSFKGNNGTYTATCIDEKVE